MTRTSGFRAALVLCRRAARLIAHPLVRVAAAYGVVTGSAALAAGSVSMRLQGDILASCSVDPGPASTLELGDITAPGQRDYGFHLSCNAPFSYEIEAQHGALIHAGGATAPGGFAAGVPYEIAVHIPTDGASIDDLCAGETIVAGRVTCPFSTSGSNIALGSAARLKITWNPQGRIPLAGTYVERLTVRVATSL
jgi:hypothetical protein